MTAAIAAGAAFAEIPTKDGDKDRTLTAVALTTGTIALGSLLFAVLLDPDEEEASRAGVLTVEIIAAGERDLPPDDPETKRRSELDIELDRRDSDTQRYLEECLGLTPAARDAATHVATPEPDQTEPHASDDTAVPGKSEESTPGRDITSPAGSAAESGPEKTLAPADDSPPELEQ